jgi:protein-disulfide isomerase
MQTLSKYIFKTLGLFLLLVIVVKAGYKKTPTISIPSYYKKFCIKYGEDSASVKVYQLYAVHCITCRIIHEKYFPTLKSKFIDSKKIQWIFVPYAADLDTLYFMAALNYFPPEEQKNLLSQLFPPIKEKQPSLNTILKMARLLDSSYLKIFDAKNNKELLEQAAQFQKYVKTDGTPTFYINGQEIENIPTLKELEVLICEKLRTLEKD